ncbi:hypothetical protein E2C01_052280 [Portunus trituberculatus]|uniref:Uncharacterized protein n=1 Tax=Portunus trituberculatus TaxID=210409 RepID=A0A5B7GNY6_PORTR|nr:hypothetical protein [Portunus trituberculatus]
MLKDQDEAGYRPGNTAPRADINARHTEELSPRIIARNLPVHGNRLSTQQGERDTRASPPLTPHTAILSAPLTSFQYHHHTPLCSNIPTHHHHRRHTSAPQHITTNTTTLPQPNTPQPQHTHSNTSSHHHYYTPIHTTTPAHSLQHPHGLLAPPPTLLGETRYYQAKMDAL